MAKIIFLGGKKAGKTSNLIMSLQMALLDSEDKLEQSQQRVRELEAKIAKLKDPVQEIPEFIGTLDQLNRLGL